MNVAFDSQLGSELSQARHQLTFAGNYKRCVRHCRAHPGCGVQERRMIFHRVAQVGDDRDQATWLLRQTKHSERFFPREPRSDFLTLKIESVVMLNDPRRTDAFTDQLIPHADAETGGAALVSPGSSSNRQLPGR